MSNQSDSTSMRLGVNEQQGSHKIRSHESTALGPASALKRSFGFISILGFLCSTLITWEGSLAVSPQALFNGGPAGVIWGFLIVWMGTTSTFAVIAELASMAPHAAGQYYWVWILAPPPTRKLLSYVTAWMTISGWQGLAASAGYLVGSLVQGLIVFNQPSYVPKPWQKMLFYWAATAFAISINVISNKALARFESLFLVLHLFGFLGVLIPLVCLGPRGDATSVFTLLLNGGNWPNQTVSFFVGLPASVFAVIGSDSVVHMSEEVKNAAITVPRVLMWGLLTNGALGFGMLLALMFRLGSIDAALQAQETVGYPFIEIFQQAVKSRIGASLMTGIVIVLGTSGTVGIFAGASRLLWSFARDGATPFAGIISRVNLSASVPLHSIAATMTVSLLLSLITLGSSDAFNNIVSIGVAGLYSSYLLCCGLILWRRTSGNVTLNSATKRPLATSSAGRGVGELTWGPWCIPEPWGTLNNSFACVYLSLLLFWIFWPPQTPTDAANMNFSVLVFGFVVLASVLWYFVRGKNVFKGPLLRSNAEIFSDQH